MIGFWLGYALGVTTGPLAVFLIAFYFTSRDKSAIVRHSGEVRGKQHNPAPFARPRDSAPPGSPPSQLTLRDLQSPSTSQQRRNRSRHASPPQRRP